MTTQSLKEGLDIHSQIAYTLVGDKEVPVALIGDKWTVGPPGTPFSSRECSLLWEYYPGLQFALKGVVGSINHEDLKGKIVLVFGDQAKRWASKYPDLHAHYITNIVNVYKWRKYGGRFYGKYDGILRTCSEEIEAFYRNKTR